MKRFAFHAAVAIATLSVTYAVWQMREAIVMLLFSLAISAAAEPIVDAMARRIPRGLAIGLVCFLGLLVLGLILAVTLPSVVDEARQAADEASQALARIGRDWPHGNFVQREIAAGLAGMRLSEIAGGSSATSLLTGAIGVSMTAFEAVGAAVVVLILSIYWTASTSRFERLWLSLLPSDYRSTARDTWHDVKVGVGDRLRKSLGQTVLTILALEGGFSAMGLHYVAFPALLGGLILGAPVGGSPIVVALAVATGLATSPVVAVCAGAYTLAVLLILRRVLGPRLFRGRDYSSFVFVVVLIAVVELYGIAGLIVSPVVAAAVQIVGERLLSLKAARASVALERGDLDQRLEAIKEMLAAQGEPPPELMNLAERLSSIIDEAMPPPGGPSAALGTGRRAA